MIRKVFTFPELQNLIKSLTERFPVMGPKERGDQPGFVHFDWLNASEDVVWDYKSTTLPPKKAFFPPAETLFSFTLGDPPEIRETLDREPFVLTGVHPCDLAAIEVLDDAFGHPPADNRWKKVRAQAIIMGVDCQPDEYCFCTSMDCDRARSPADIFITPISSGFLVESLSVTGELVLKNSSGRDPVVSDEKQAERWREEKADRIRSSLEVSPSRFAAILEEKESTRIWRDLAERCFSCGSCNIVCPTCYCFDMDDEFDLTLREGTRMRAWDSCQLPDFALVAGDYNYREKRWKRIRHRWYHKFLYLFNKFGQAFCTGCGRCRRECTANIDIVNVSNEIIRFSHETKGQSHA